MQKKCGNPNRRTGNSALAMGSRRQRERACVRDAVFSVPSLLAGLASLDTTRQPGGRVSRPARAPHPRRRADPRPRRRRVPGVSSRARAMARDMAPSSPSLFSLHPPPTPQKPETTAAHAAGNTAQAPHDARDPAAHTRTPAAQTLPSGSRVAPRGAITGARERRRTRPRARGAWRISRDDRGIPEVRAVPRTSHRAPEGAETARVPLHRRYRRFFVTFQNKKLQTSRKLLANFRLVQKMDYRYWTEGFSRKLLFCIRNTNFTYREKGLDDLR